MTQENKKNKGGRPTKEEEQEKKRLEKNKKISESLSKMTEENIHRLRESFAIDATIEEACYYADIAVATYYNWIEKNPKLLEEFDALRNKPILKARQEVVMGLEGDKHFSFQYLRSKRKEEFGEKVTVEHKGSIEGLGNLTEEEKKLREEYEASLKKLWAKPLETKNED